MKLIKEILRIGVSTAIIEDQIVRREYNRAMKFIRKVRE